MPLTSQALYFHLGMTADDDGVVEAYPVIRMIGCNEDDLRVLVAKGLVKILNEDLVTYITDWHENNTIRADRKIDSIYKDLLLQILPFDNQVADICQSDDNQMTVICPPSDNQVATKRPPNISKDKLSKDKVSKDNRNNNNIPSKAGELFENLWSLYPRKQGKAVARVSFLRAIKDGVPVEEIEKGISAYNEYIKASGCEPQYIKQGGTFFRQRAWEDDWTPRRKNENRVLSREEMVEAARRIDAGGTAHDWGAT